MPYYQLDANLADPSLAIQGDAPDYEVPWSMGVPFRTAVPEPVRCSLDPRGGPRLPDIFLTDIPMFSERLIEVLERAGVDNLVTFGAEVEDTAGRVHTNYKAVNIVGTVSCADLARSELSSRGKPPLMNFRTLVLDESRAEGRPLFRLAESTRIILIDEKVKTAVEAAGLIGVRLLSIDEAG